MGGLRDHGESNDPSLIEAFSNAVEARGHAALQAAGVNARDALDVASVSAMVDNAPLCLAALDMAAADPVRTLSIRSVHAVLADIIVRFCRSDSGVQGQRRTHSAQSIATAIQPFSVALAARIRWTYLPSAGSGLILGACDPARFIEPVATLARDVRAIFVKVSPTAAFAFAKCVQHAVAVLLCLHGASIAKHLQAGITSPDVRYLAQLVSILTDYLALPQVQDSHGHEVALWTAMKPFVKFGSRATDPQAVTTCVRATATLLQHWAANNIFPRKLGLPFVGRETLQYCDTVVIERCVASALEKGNLFAAMQLLNVGGLSLSSSGLAKQRDAAMQALKRVLEAAKATTTLKGGAETGEPSELPAVTSGTITGAFVKKALVLLHRSVVEEHPEIAYALLPHVRDKSMQWAPKDIGVAISVFSRVRRMRVVLMALQRQLLRSVKDLPPHQRARHILKTLMTLHDAEHIPETRLMEVFHGAAFGSAKAALTAEERREQFRFCVHALSRVDRPRRWLRARKLKSVRDRLMAIRAHRIAIYRTIVTLHHWARALLRDDATTIAKAVPADGRPLPIHDLFAVCVASRARADRGRLSPSDRTVKVLSDYVSCAVMHGDVGLASEVSQQVLACIGATVTRRFREVLVSMLIRVLDGADKRPPEFVSVEMQQACLTAARSRLIPRQLKRRLLQYVSVDKLEIAAVPTLARVATDSAMLESAVARLLTTGSTTEKLRTLNALVNSARRW
jgi:hypothetical protein